MSNSLNKILSQISLKEFQPSWQQVVKNSLINIFFRLFIDKWTLFINKYAEGSFFARFSEFITIFSIILLVFVSPFVSTNFNAALVLFAVFATTIKHLLRPETIPKKSDLLLLTIIAYFASGLVAVGFSHYLVTALKGFSKMLIYLIAYFVFLVNLENLKNIRAVIWAIILSATIVSIYGVYQYIIKVEPYQGALWDDPNASSFKTTRVYSFLLNPNLLAGYLLPTASFTAVFYYLNLGWRKIVVMISFYLQLACLYFTYSRGGWIGAAGMLIVLALGSLIIFSGIIFKSRIWKTLIISSFVLLVFGGILFLFFSPSTVERFMTIFTLRGHSSNSFRVNVWLSSFTMFKDSFWWGIGPGNDVFNKIYPLYMFSGFKALSAYNIFLETAIETGIFGLLIFIIMLFTHVARCAWGIFSDIEYSSRVLLLGCLGALVALIIQGMVDTVWYRPQIHILFWLVMAIISVVSSDEIARKKFNE